MKWEQQICPEYGEPPKGTIEKMMGLCHIEPNGQGGFEYHGDTEIWWDDPTLCSTNRAAKDSDVITTMSGSASAFLSRRFMQAAALPPVSAYLWIE